MKVDRHLAFHTRRDAWVEINLATFESNVQKIRRSLPQGVSMMAVIKADAYGHGAPMMLPILESLDVAMIGVASVDEAAQIRASKTTLPILVLGPSPDWALHAASDEGFQVTIYTQQHLDILNDHFRKTGAVTEVQIKVDTGMHRIGVPYEQAIEFIQYCHTQASLNIQGIFTHLASPIDPSLYTTQIERWKTVVDAIDFPLPWIHFASSSAITPDLKPYANMVRPGIGLFGYGPLAESLGLKPMMQVKARLVHIQDLAPGEGVSYGHTYHNTNAQIQRIATLPLGYADGIPRHLSNQIHVLYKGHRLPQVGAICMDQCMINVTDIPDAQTGDIVTLIGEDGKNTIWLDTWAKQLNTIEYELMTGLRVRLPRTYVR